MPKGRLIAETFGMSGTNLTDKAYDFLRSEIIRGNFRPNERLWSWNSALGLRSVEPRHEKRSSVSHMRGLVQSRRRRLDCSRTRCRRDPADIRLEDRSRRLCVKAGRRAGDGEGP